MRVSKGLLIGGGVVVGLIVLGLILLSSLSSLKTQGIKLEGDLTAQYSADQNEYSNYAAGLVEQLAVTEAQKDAVKDVVSAYVSGRKTEGGGQLAQMVKEAVPNLDQSTYTLIINYIQAGRTKFKNRQDQMISNTRVYENWQNEGIVQPIIIRSVLGFPTDRLRATVGNQSVTGQAALEQMRVLITTSETQKAFQTGNDKPVVVPNSQK